MHPAVFDVFDDICHGRVPANARVLEVGARSTHDSLLYLPSLEERHVLLAGCARVETRIVLRPPRIIGFGWKASSNE